MDFFKYSATGNDFIVVDNRPGKASTLPWKELCCRRTGIGADGVLFFEEEQGHDFRMTYFNSDGHEVAMCGNGARALSHFAFEVLKIKCQAKFKFKTLTGTYFSEKKGRDYFVTMTEIGKSEEIDHFPKAKKSLFLEVGVPHCVFEVEGLDEFDVYTEGKKLQKFYSQGTNVNFISPLGKNNFQIRTYERGVENETLACGTGVVASSLAMKEWYNFTGEVKVKTEGGPLSVFLGEEVLFGGEVSLIYQGQLNKHSY